MTELWHMNTHPRFGYQRCSRCVMDTSDTQIWFDQHGVCNHCRGFDAVHARVWKPNDEGRRTVQGWVEKVKAANAANEFDVCIGLSGGADSCWMAYLVKKLGLRALVVHVDTGWNSELAVHNIETVVRKLGFELQTHVVDWEEMRDLQVAFLKAGVANQDTPQDHAIFCAVFRETVLSGVRFLVNGMNYSTECILPRSWGYNALDTRHVRAVHRLYGTRPLVNFPLFTFQEYCAYQYDFPSQNSFEAFPLLNFLPYNKAEAMRVLEAELGFKPYAYKHGESRWTKFFQGYYLPVKFGYDKRLAHLSSLIVTGQVSRDQALDILRRPPFDEKEIADDIAFVVRKLELTDQEFQDIMKAPCRNASDYPWNYENFEAARQLSNRVGDLFREWQELMKRAEM